MSLAAGNSTRTSRATATSARAALVEALTTVEGLTPTPSMPDTVATGSAWPVWVQTRHRGHLANTRQYTFDVYATLPAAYRADTVDAGDLLADAMLDALFPVAVTEPAEPVALAIDGGTVMPGLRMRVTVR